jgi:hypothetical protein
MTLLSPVIMALIIAVFMLGEAMLAEAFHQYNSALKVVPILKSFYVFYAVLKEKFKYFSAVWH